MNLLKENIYLRLLTSDDASQDYLNWLNDDLTTQFLECKINKYTLEDLKEYIIKINNGTNNFLFGIFTKEKNEHIGNIKIGSINHTHKFADIGLIIGNKNAWGKGYGTEAIIQVTNFAKDNLNLNKLIAGIYENNIASLKAFIKAGYNECARYKKHRLYKGNYVDEIVVEKLLN